MNRREVLKAAGALAGARNGRRSVSGAVTTAK